jgi:hypothetical protein
VLQCLDRYGKAWGISFNRGSPGTILAYNVHQEPTSITVGSITVTAKHKYKHLSSTFTDDNKWHTDLTLKLRNANYAFQQANAHGLLGGNHPTLMGSRYAHASIFPKLDNGRVIPDMFLPIYKNIRSQYDTFHLRVGRKILGVSQRAASDGILGELGWIPDSV